MSWHDYALLWLSGLAAGAVNALAGGGTLITFPTMVALGLPSLVANVSNTVALCPGYFGAALAQRRDLAPQRQRVAVLTPIATVGGIAGAYVLRHTSAGAFDRVAPFLVLAAVGLLAAGPWIKRRAQRADTVPGSTNLALASLATAAVALYGGYFGAGMSVMIIAVLSVMLHDSLVRVTALKQLLALVINGAAAAYLLITNGDSGLVRWPVVLVVGSAAVVGGALGARLSQRVNEATLRTVVIAIGVAFAVSYWLR